MQKMKYNKVKLLKTSGQIYSDYYTLGDTVDYFYGPLVPSAGYLSVWELEHYHEGLLLRVPDRKNPLQLAEKVDMPHTFDVFAEKVRWDIIMRLSNAGDVNMAILKGHASELIQVSEALQEKKIVQIASTLSRIPSEWCSSQDRRVQVKAPCASVFPSSCWPADCAPARFPPTTIS